MGIYINNNGTAERYDGAPSAAGQSYNNASSGLSATNTQAAIDEVVSEKTDNTNLGTVELTTTATAAHAVGTYFILGGQFVKTAVSIGVGDTIAVGTNVTATDIGSVLTELNSNIATKVNTSYIKIVGGTVANATSVQFSYPSGFTKNNCVSIGCYLNAYDSLYFNDEVSVILGDSGVIIRNDSGLDRSCYAILYRYS